MGKGSATTTTTTAPNPVAGRAYKDVLGRASDVAQLPYTAYSGELVAPMNAQQNMAIGNINANAGFAQPYMTQAGSMIQDASGPLDWQQWVNPWQQNVVDATMAQFAEQNQRQQQGILGNAIAQNALGGDRVGVAQSELARQQSLAQMPIIADLYSKGFQNAISTAQQQQQAQMAAAYGLGNIGVAGQQAALQGAGAQFGAGTAMQGTQQAQDTAAYNQFLQAQAFPYAQTQWQAGIVGGIGPQLGGTSTQTAPPPSPWNAIGGLAMAGLGAASGNPFAALSGVSSLLGGGQQTMAAPGASYYQPVGNYSMPVYGMPYAKDGGRIAGFAEGGAAIPYGGVSWMPSVALPGARPAQPQAAAPQASQPQGGMGDISSMVQTALNAKKLAGLFSADGGFVPPPTPDSIMMPRGYDDGGVAGFEPLMFQDRAQPVQDAIAGGEFDPQGANSTTFAPPPVPTPPTGPSMFAGVPVDPAKPMAGVMLPPEITQGTSRPRPPAEGPPGEALAFDGTPQAGFAPPPVAAAPQSSGSGPFGLSEEARMGLIAAGLGMAASRSPFPGVAIGEGGLQGISAYQALRRDKRAQEKTKFDMQHAVETLKQRAKLAADALAESTRQHDLTEAHRQRMYELEAMKPVTDPYGRMLQRDPKTKTYRFINPETGLPEGTPQSDVPGPSKPASAGVDDARLRQIATTTKEIEARGVGGDGVDPLKDVPSGMAEKTNPAALDDLPPEQRNRVMAIAEGRSKLPNTHRGVDLLIKNKVYAYYPDFDETAFTRRQRAATEFTSGVSGRNLRAVGTLAGHLGTLYEATIDLANTRNKLFNAASKAVREQYDKEYQQKLAKYEMAAEAVSNEGPKVFAGTQSALADREEWRKKLGATAPYDTQISGIKTMVDLVESRVAEMASSYNGAMATSHAPEMLVGKKARDTFNKLRHATGEREDKPEAKAGPSDADKKRALDWANANPNDPRAKEIKRKLGAE